MKTNGVQHYLWRAVGYISQIPEFFFIKNRNKLAALRLFKERTKLYSSPGMVVTIGLLSYYNAIRDIDYQDR